MGHEHPIVLCLLCLYRHFNHHTKCPGPCRQQINAIVFDDGEVQVVEERIANVNGAVAGQDEEVARLTWMGNRGYDAKDAGADNDALREAERAALDGDAASAAALVAVRQRVEARIAQHQRLLAEWMAEQHAAAVAAQLLRQQERERELAEQAAAAQAGD